jgi:hypothetical protein
MKLGFEETQSPYKSGSQSARAWTERWVRDWVYCPNCGSPKINMIEVMKCVEAIGKRDFQIEDVYAFEDRLSLLYPGNRNVKPKSQQLQFLRDRGYIDFISRGYYRLRVD